MAVVVHRSPLQIKWRQWWKSHTAVHHRNCEAALAQMGASNSPPWSRVWGHGRDRDGTWKHFQKSHKLSVWCFPANPRAGEWKQAFCKDRFIWAGSWHWKFIFRCMSGGMEWLERCRVEVSFLVKNYFPVLHSREKGNCQRKWIPVQWRFNTRWHLPR